MDFETVRVVAAVDMCEECYTAFQEQEATIRRLYGSRWFWLKMLLVHCLAWAGLRFTPFERLMNRTGFARR